MAQEWWQNAPVVEAQAIPGYIPGRPKTPLAPTALQMSAEARAVEDQGFQRDQAVRQDAAAARAERALVVQERRAEAQLGATGVGKPTEYQAKSAGFLGRMLRSNEAWAQVPEGSRDPRSLPGQWLAETFPHLDNSMNNGDRQASDQNARDFITAVLRQESGAAIGANEYLTAYKTYFPMPGDEPAALKQKELTRRQAIEGFRVAAGPLAANVPNVGTGFEPKSAGGTVSLADSLILNIPTQDSRLSWLTPGLRTELNILSQSAQSPDEIVAWFAKQGQTLPRDQAEKALAYYQKGGREAPGVQPGVTPEQRAEIDRRVSGTDVAGATAMGLADTVTVGVLDELGAVADAALGSGNGSFGDRYDAALTINRGVQDRVHKESPYAYGAGQVAGAVVPWGRFGRGAAGAGELARVGAIQGGAYGFGSGDDGLASRLIGAAGGSALGAVGGGVAGAVLPRVGESLNRLVNTPARQVRAAEEAGVRSNAQRLIDAAGTEDIPISRPIVDSRVRNSVTALETTPGGGDPVRKGLEATRDALEVRTGALSPGTPRTPYEAGAIVQEAGKRFIDRTGKRAGVKYRLAEDLSRGVRITPNRALAEIEANLSELGHAPETNRPLIGYLEELKNDLRGGPLTINTLRNIRSAMRGNINTRNLTATDAERRVSAVMDKASDDITSGLSSRPDALTAYRSADKFWRERQTHIGDVLQRFMGRKDSPLSAEQALSRVKSMASDRGDSRRLAELWKTMDGGEQADLAATFAADLGRGRNGDFSAAHLVTQVEQLPVSARELVFGPAGAKSMENLRIIASELRDVQRNLNNSRTGVAMNYRTALSRLLVGGAAGLTAGGVSLGAMGAAGGAAVAAAGARKAGNMLDARAARLLMNPDLTRWARAAPRTADPATIQRHLSRLNAIATRYPALAADVGELSNVITAQLGSGVRTASAESQNRPRNAEQR